MDSKFVMIRRPNGEQFYINIGAINLIFENPVEKLVTVSGAGFEKNFSPADAEQLLTHIRKHVIG